MPQAISQSDDRRGRKRKRKSPSATQQSSDDGGSNFNSGFFLSHPSHKAAQYELAGFSDTDNDPTMTIRNFPHRGFRRKKAGESQEQKEETTEGEEGLETDDSRHSKPRPRENDRKGHFDTLLRSIEQFLDQGEIEKASRAYGLVLHLRPRSLPVDMRSYNLWATGAEILMRHGEESRLSKPTRRWGSAANMGKVRAYYETLVRQFPYDPKYPNKICAVDFWLALLCCEVYNAYAEYVSGLTDLGDDSDDGDHDDDIPGQEEGIITGIEDDEAERHLHDVSRPGPTAGKRREDIRTAALESMREILQRLEKLMEQLPYSKHAHFLRLRASASLFAADLCLPLASRSSSPGKLREADARRSLEQRAAMKAIGDLARGRRDVNVITNAAIDAYLLKLQPEESPPPSANFYSELPIRMI